ncbi:MAG: YceI family protein [Steroidobacterales bacterium]
MASPSGAIVIALLPAIVAGAAAAAEETYVFDPVHSQPGFEVRHMIFTTQRGTFSKLSGKVTLDRAAKTGGIEVTIDTTSLRSYDPRLDNILKGEGYFNVAKYPTMMFKADRLDFDGDKVEGAQGELTMLGTSRPVSLKVSNFSCGENPFNKRPMCGAEVSTTIKRSEWGMKTGIGRSSSDEVHITIPIEAYRE